MPKITLSLSPELYRALEREARHHDQSVPALVQSHLRQAYDSGQSLLTLPRIPAQDLADHPELPLS